MASVPTGFLRSLEYMRRLPDTYTSVSENTLIHDARNDFAGIAIRNGFDRVLWIDSDMTFKPDLLTGLSEDMDEGRDMVCGLFFKRVSPTMPVILDRFETRTHPDGEEYIKPVLKTDYPRDAIFEVAGCGFAAVMTSVPLLKAMWDKYGPPFSYHSNLGEDYSFCWRAKEIGAKIWCDSSIKVGHIGQAVYSEATWDAQQSRQPIPTEGEE